MGKNLLCTTRVILHQRMKRKTTTPPSHTEAKRARSKKPLTPLDVPYIQQRFEKRQKEPLKPGDPHSLGAASRYMEDSPQFESPRPEFVWWSDEDDSPKSTNSDISEITLKGFTPRSRYVKPMSPLDIAQLKKGRAIPTVQPSKKSHIDSTPTLYYGETNFPFEGFYDSAASSNKFRYDDSSTDMSL